MNSIRNCLAGLALVALAATASAGTTTLAGSLSIPGDSAVVGSDLGAPDYVDNPADNVALYAFNVWVAGAVSIVSTGFAGGGVDPYFTLFTGSGDSATFLDSNYAQTLTTGGDFSWSGTLATGRYEIALGTYDNMSFAENLGTGTLGDGFIFLGEPGSLGTGAYSLALTTPAPEPTSSWTLGIGLLVVGLRAWRTRRAA